MRILCLHGNGANSHVMELQIAPLKYEFGSEHQFECVEAALSASTSRSQDTAFSTSDQSYFDFYNPEELSTLEPAVKRLENYITSEGPFDGILGFSGGAVLAALYVLTRRRQDSVLPIRFVIFLSSGGIGKEASYLGLDKHLDRITIPTVHIWGADDRFSEELSQMCDPAVRLNLVHDGGYEFPRGTYLTTATHLIRRCMYSVE